MNWKPTPDHLLLKVIRLDPYGQWQLCRIQDLVVGDVFKCYHPDTGAQLDPTTLDEVGKDFVSFAHSNAMQNRQTNRGYGVDCTSGPYDEVVRSMAN